MTEWKEYKLGEVVSIASGFAYKGEYIGKGDGLLLGMGCVSYKEKFLMSGARPYLGDCAERYYANAGDIVLATRQQSDNLPILGMPAIIPNELKDKKLIVGANLYRVTNNSDFDNKYIYWLLKTPAYVRHIASCKTGTTVGMITKADIENFVFIAPDKSKRKQILETIDSLDDKIDLLHRENATLEQMAETLFRQWFVVEAKEDWEEGTVADLVEFNPTRKLVKGTIAPFLEMSNLSTSTYSPTYWYDRAYNSGTKFENGDTLLARITPCLENGKTAYVDFLCDNQVGWGSTEFIVMHSKMGLHPFFTYVVAKYQDFRDFAESCMSGSSGRQRVDVDNLKQYSMAIPDQSTVELFNNRIDNIVSKMHNNNNQIRTLIETRDGLLPRLMSGEIKI